MSFFRWGKSNAASTAHESKSEKGKGKEDAVLLNLASCDHPNPYSHLSATSLKERSEKEKKQKELEELKQREKERFLVKNDNGRLYSNPSRFDTSYIADHARYLIQEKVEQKEKVEEKLKGKDKDEKGLSMKASNNDHGGKIKAKVQIPDNVKSKERIRTQSLITPKLKPNLSKSATSINVYNYVPLENEEKQKNKESGSTSKYLKDLGKSASSATRRRTVSTGQQTSSRSIESQLRESPTTLPRELSIASSIPLHQKEEISRPRPRSEDRVREWLSKRRTFSVSSNVSHPLIRCTSLPSPLRRQQRSNTSPPSFIASSISEDTELAPQAGPSNLVNSEMISKTSGRSHQASPSIRSTRSKLSQQHQNPVSPRSQTSPFSEEPQRIETIFPSRSDLKSQISNYSMTSKASSGSGTADPSQLLSALEDLATTLEKTREEKKIKKSQKEREDRRLEQKIKKEIKREVDRRLSPSTASMRSPLSGIEERVSTGVNTEMADYFVPSHTKFASQEDALEIEENRRESNATTTTNQSSTFSTGRRSEMTRASSFLSSSGSESYGYDSHSKAKIQLDRAQFVPSGLVAAQSVKSSSSTLPSSLKSDSGIDSKGSSPASATISLDSTIGVLLPLAASQTRSNLPEKPSSPQLNVATSQVQPSDDSPTISQERRNELLAKLYGLTSPSQLTTSSPSTSDLGTVLFVNGLPAQAQQNSLPHHSFASMSKEEVRNNLGLSIGGMERLNHQEREWSPRQSSEISWGSLGPPSDLGVALALEEQAAMRREESFKSNLDKQVGISNSDLKEEFIQEQRRLFQLIQDEERQKQRKALELLFDQSDLSYGSLGTPTEFASAVSNTTLSSPNPSKVIDHQQTPKVNSNESLSQEDLNNYELHLNALIRLAKSDPQIRTLLQKRINEGLNSEDEIVEPKRQDGNQSMIEGHSSSNANDPTEISSFLLETSEAQGRTEWLQKLRNNSKQRVEGWRGEVSSHDPKNPQKQKRELFAEI